MAQPNNENRRRLSMNVPKDLYGTMLMAAHERNCTMTKWVLRAIVNQIKLEKKYRES